MEMLFRRIFTMFLAVFMVASFVSCGDDETPKRTGPDLCYAYFEFSDDMLEIYDVSLSVTNIEFDKLCEFKINDETPFKVTPQGTKCYLLKCKTGGTRPVLMNTIVKKTKDYSFFDANPNRKFNLITGYSFYEPSEMETEDDIKDALYYSCHRNTKVYTGEEFAAANTSGPTLYADFGTEFAQSSYVAFQ